MSIASKIRKLMPKRLKGVVIGAAIAAASMTGLYAAHVQAQNVYNCDGNAVVYCGASSVSQLISKYNGGDGHNKAYTIQDIYHWFGIGSGDINGMKSDAVEGSVDRNGNIYAGNTLVATNALTGGRDWISGSAKKKYGATTFYVRHPSVSFLQQSISAMVVMKNGVFQFAILHACGNPVIGTPKKPSYSIQKLVRANGGKYSSDITVPSGSDVQYQITVKSTGAVPVDNVTVHDVLPSDITYTSGSLAENGKNISSEAGSFFGKGVFISSIKNGSSVVFTFNAVAGKSKPTAKCCKAEVLNNEGYISAPELPGQNSGAVVRTTCTPPPPQVTLTCNQLTLTPGSIDQNTGDQQYTLTATASAKNAVITGYAFNFDDGSSKTVATSSTAASTTHTYTPGTYGPSVTVTATANGKSYTATSQNCAKSITVKPPVPSTLTCDQLTLTPGTVTSDGSTEYTLAVSASEQNATITGYKFTFGDNSQPVTVSTDKTTASTTHTYAPSDSTYNASVTVSGVVKGKDVTVSSPNCAGSITVKYPPVALTCDQLTLTPGDVNQTTGDQQYTLSAQATAKNATITAYVFDFGDNSQPVTVQTGNTTASTTHTYAPNTYTASVKVEATGANGKSYTATSQNCAKPVNVKQPVVAYACDSLDATPVGVADSQGNQAYKFVANASVTNATITNYVFNFDDNNQTQTVVTADKTASATHTYAPGTYNPTVSVTVTLNDGTTKQVTSKTCAATFTVSPTPTCTSPTTGKTYPAGSSECQPQTCTSPTTGKTYPAGSPECTPTCTSPTNGQTYPMGSSECLTQPTSLVNTGPGSIAGLFAGATIVGMIGYRLYIGRRLSRNNL